MNAALWSRRVGLFAVMAALSSSACIGEITEGDVDEGGSSGSTGTGASTDTSVGTGAPTGTETAAQTGTGAGTGTGTGGGCPEGDPKMCGIVDAHNAVRAGVNPAANPPLQPLVWSQEAANVAAQWAANCQFGHNPALGSLGMGENIYAAWGKSSSPQEVVQAWASEVADYNYASNSCSGVCGHYTQVVWRDTTGVGCAVQNCPDGMEIWVCDYAPPGNYIGQKPY